LLVEKEIWAALSFEMVGDFSTLSIDSIPKDYRGKEILELDLNLSLHFLNVAL
jgi:hypothetical protein